MDWEILPSWSLGVLCGVDKVRFECAERPYEDAGDDHIRGGGSRQPDCERFPFPTFNLEERNSSSLVTYLTTASRSVYDGLIKIWVAEAPAPNRPVKMNSAIKAGHIHCFVLRAISVSAEYSKQLGAVQAEDHAS
jgi:hypothetical protein